MREFSEVAPGVEFNGVWYRVTAVNGEVWSFDEEDVDVAYAEGAISAWTIWRDYVASV